jgi:hypothetical protein
MGFMPYQWEKGYFPTAIERWFNEGLDQIGPNDSAQTILAQPGPGRRLRAIWRYASVIRQLRDGAANPAAIRKVTKTNSIIESGLFAATGAGWVNAIAHDWFGMELVGSNWYRQTPGTWVPSKSLGHWNGYFGNVELIVCETLQRMLELSLGVDHLDPMSLPHPVPDDAEIKGIQQRLKDTATHVWPVYMYLTCPNPWFESWVTWQCHDTDSTVRGQVTVMLSTPGHDRPVTPSPIDLEDDLRDLAVAGSAPTANPYFLHGRDPANSNYGYEGEYLASALQGGPGTVGPTGAYDRMGNAPTGPRVPKVPRTNHQGMWIITHVNHDSTIVWNNFPNPTSPNWGRPGVESWDLPPFAVHKCAAVGERRDVGGQSDPAAVTGMYDVVVVQPASRDGGVW